MSLLWLRSAGWHTLMTAKLRMTEVDAPVEIDSRRK